MKEIVIASKNKGKIAEFTTLFRTYGINVLSLYDLDDTIEDVEETGTTFRENAQLKAEQIANVIKKPVLADDSGLVIHALDGRPGVYSARYAGESATDELNNEKVLTELEDVPTNKRDAYFICVLALAIPGEKTVYQTGKCHGTITNVPIGDNGFGYDPIFVPDGYNETMAELSSDVKNKISHRYHAIVKMKQWLEQTMKGVFNE